MNKEKDTTDILEELCEASDDCAWSQCRGTSDDTRKSDKNFGAVWNNAIEYFSGKDSAIKQLNDDKAELAGALRHMIERWDECEINQAEHGDQWHARKILKKHEESIDD